MAGEAILSAAASHDIDDMLRAGLRLRDREEVTAALGMTDLRKLLDEGVRDSYDAGAARGADGKLWCIFGAVPYGSALTDTAILWALSTDEMERHAGALTRATKRYIDHVRGRYPKLVNFVDVRNTASVRWLKRLGFTMEEPKPYGVEQRPFHRFHIGF